MRAYAAAIVTIVGTLSSFSFAGSTQADARYEEGRAFAKKKDWENARQSFAQAALLEPNDLRYLWNLAISEAKTHHEVEALRHFRRYAHHDQVTSDDKREALHFIAELERHTARITIDAPKLIRISVDNEDFGLTPLDAIDVTPGAHTVEGRNPAGQTRKLIVRAIKANFVVAKLDFDPAPVTPVAPPAPIAPPADPPPPPPAKSYAPPALTYILGGVAIASAAVGSIFLTNAYSAADDAKAIRGGNPGGFCNDRNSSACKSLIDANDSAATKSTVSTALFITAGATLAGALVTWLVWPKSKHHEQVTWIAPQVGERSVGAALGGSF